MIAIHKGSSDFYTRWIQCCQRKNVEYKIVNCYDNDIISQLKGCKALMWHLNHISFRDNLISKQILKALDHSGFVVFPNYKTVWHFDDKLAQKYLLEAIDAPLVKSYVFFNKEEALLWAGNTTYPKVFKLRGGAGSQNVRLVRSKSDCVKLIHKAFGKGFPKYDAWGSLKERLYKYKKGKMPFFEVVKGFIRLFYAPTYARLTSNEVGYAYFQQFMPNNDSDTRIIVIDGKAFGLKRYVRENDFRASGSGNFAWDKSLFDERCIQIAFELTKKLELQVGAFDFIFDENNTPLIVEVSYGFVSEVYDPCPGYWDEALNWHEGKTIKEEWMVDLVLKQIAR